jgi:hypothetical protein
MAVACRPAIAVSSRTNLLLGVRHARSIEMGPVDHPVVRAGSGSSAAGGDSRRLASSSSSAV